MEPAGGIRLVCVLNLTKFPRDNAAQYAVDVRELGDNLFDGMAGDILEQG